MECWEYKHCSPEVMQQCPAYPDKGRSCWKVTSTKCDGGKVEMASLSEKIEHCRRCEFYENFANRY